METNKQPRFLKWCVIIAIAVVANMFVNYALSLVYKEPSYDAFCPQSQVNGAIDTQQQCVAVGGQWNANAAPLNAGSPAGYCNPDYTCSTNYQNASDAYHRTVFIILVVVAVVLIIAGALITANSVVKTALSLSGALSLVIASFRYWSTAHDWLKVVILGVALAALIYLAVKKFGSSN